MKKIFMIIIMGGLSIAQSNFGVYDTESDAFSANTKWHFPLTLEVPIAQKYKECTYYPEVQVLSCVSKDGKNATKEKKNIFVQPGVKPQTIDSKEIGCPTSIKIYGYYIDEDTKIKYWVWKLVPEKKEPGADKK